VRMRRAMWGALEVALGLALAALMYPIVRAFVEAFRVAMEQHRQ
jgi:hypothetical protein